MSGEGRVLAASVIVLVASLSSAGCATSPCRAHYFYSQGEATRMPPSESCRRRSAERVVDEPSDALRNAGEPAALSQADGDK